MSVGFVIFCAAAFIGLSPVAAQISLPAGGDDFDSAAALRPGTYQGGFLADGESLYYYVQVKPGQMLSVSAGTFEEGGSTLYLYDEDEEELKSVYDEKPEINWLVGSDKSSKFYIKLENDYAEVESFTFKFSLMNYYDVDSQTDAGDSFGDAMDVAIGSYDGFLAGNAGIADEFGDDVQDYYKVSLSKGVTYNFNLVPSNETELTLGLYNSGRQLIEEDSSVNKGAVVSLYLTPSDDTDVFVSVFNNFYTYQDEIVNYQLEIKSSEAVTEFYSCAEYSCEAVGAYVSLAACQKASAKTCYSSATCDGKCESGEQEEEVCECSTWEDSGCGKKDCDKDEMYQVRNCSSEDCDDQIRCVSKSSCGGENDEDELAGLTGFPPMFFAGSFVWGWMILMYLLFGLVGYIYMAVCLQVIAKKTNTPNGWMAWIPIANIVLMIQVAQKPLWWFIFFLIPIVNIVIAVVVFMAIAERRGKPNWVGILIIVPIVGIVIPGYLAFSSDQTVVAAPTKKE